MTLKQKFTTLSLQFSADSHDYCRQAQRAQGIFEGLPAHRAAFAAGAGGRPPFGLTSTFTLRDSFLLVFAPLGTFPQWHFFRPSSQKSADT